jgi:hypothetical protein
MSYDDILKETITGVTEDTDDKSNNHSQQGAEETEAFERKAN